MVLDILVIFGARPEIVKISALLHKLSKYFKVHLIYTNQYSDTTIKDTTFNDLEMGWPEYQTPPCDDVQRMGVFIQEQIKLNNIKFDYVVVFDNSDSAVAGSILASNTNKPLIHIGAGVRSFEYDNLDINGRFIDKRTNIFLCPTNVEKSNLICEGVVGNIYVVGDLLVDVVSNHIKIFDKYNMGDKYLVMTMHHKSNILDERKISRIISDLGNISHNIIWPIHPDSLGKIKKYKLDIPINISLIEPQPYLEFLNLINRSVGVITDSSAVQIETFLLKKPCFVMKSRTEYPQTVGYGRNFLVGNDFSVLEGYLQILEQNQIKGHPCAYNPYGSNVGSKIINILFNLNFDLLKKHREYVEMVLSKK